MLTTCWVWVIRLGSRPDGNTSFLSKSRMWQVKLKIIEFRQESWWCFLIFNSKRENFKRCEKCRMNWFQWYVNPSRVILFIGIRELWSLYIYIYIFMYLFLNGFISFDTTLYDIKYSYLIQIIGTQLYDIKYSYLIQIICTQLYDIKYS